MSRKIAVISGTRAEYGLLRSTMRALQEKGAQLQLVVTGAHLSADHGMTVSQIEKDGFDIAARVDMQLTSDDDVALAKSMGTGLGGMAEALAELKPDLAVILGDRYEMLSAAAAATMLHIPIAHIHGGEITEGAVDESIRHAITKLSYWHFASAEAYAKRIVQLGEAPERVFTVGAPGIDNMAQLELLPKELLAEALGLTLDKPFMLFTYHPETLSEQSTDEQISQVVSALAQQTDGTIIMTGANADAGGRKINDALQTLAQQHAHMHFYMSLGSLRYLSAMQACDVVIGNSSSGMIEAPVMGKAVVNIGNRQAGRMRTPAVIDCASDTAAIGAALQKALSDAFRQSIKPSRAFGTPGQVGCRIAQTLQEVNIPPSLRKLFYDMKGS